MRKFAYYYISVSDAQRTPQRMYYVYKYVFGLFRVRERGGEIEREERYNDDVA